jgi:hypothetical protein
MLFGIYVLPEHQGRKAVLFFWASNEIAVTRASGTCTAFGT